MCLPKKFVWAFSLSLGALVSGIVSLCILILCAIILGVQLFHAKECDPSPSCKQMVLRTCLSHEITGFVYLVLMILANIWFFHGIRKKKVSVLLTWIGVYALWILLLFVDMVTYIIHYITQEKKYTGAIVGLVIGLIVIGGTVEDKDMYTLLDLMEYGRVQIVGDRIQKIASVVLSWVVVASIWMCLLFVDLLVVSFLYIAEEESVGGAIAALTFGIITIAILVYGLLVKIAFWKELKSAKKEIPLRASTA